MVTHPRATDGVNRLRSLNQPRPIKVQADAIGNPVAIIHKGRRVVVEGIKDRWRIDDEWWRKTISRLYFQVVLQGRVLTLFHDLIDGGWFVQSAPLPVSRQSNLRAFVGQSARGAQSPAEEQYYANAVATNTTP
jgi:hypothetical protein